MALPSVTIGGNTTYGGQVMNYGIQPGTVSYGGSMMMSQPAATTTYAAPMTTYSTGGSMMMPPTTTYAAPMAMTGIDVNRDGRADYVVAGTDFNRDGIPDALEQPVTTTYVTQAPAMTSYAAPMQTYAAPTTYAAAPAMQTTMALPTTASMVAYPQQTQGPFVFYPAGDPHLSAPAPAAPATRDVKVAKKTTKKTGSCGSCCGPKKAAAKKK